jgi:hypothetical protein
VVWNFYLYFGLGGGGRGEECKKKRCAILLIWHYNVQNRFFFISTRFVTPLLKSHLQANEEIWEDIYGNHSRPTT